jgi:hypothetical protein
MKQGGRVEFQPMKQSEAHNGSMHQENRKRSMLNEKLSQLQKARNAAFISFSTINSGGRELVVEVN